jgi:nicotinamide phosphoribosyltransferase
MYSMYNPLNAADSYKLGHHEMFPAGMTHMQSNLTPRSSRLEGVNSVYMFGLQAYLAKFLGSFEEFFNFDEVAKEMIEEHEEIASGILGTRYRADHWRALKKVGYIPLQFNAFPEGSLVPLRVPLLTIENTIPGFHWLVNYFESVMSAELWLPITSATIAGRFRSLLDHWAFQTSDDPSFVDWQGHDFSMRGMENAEAAGMSGAGHLLVFAGTDNIPGICVARDYYGAGKFVGGSVPATEHSVMCAGGKETEKETFIRLLKKYPTGIISIVSDTWNLWKVITEVLADPEVKALIMNRNGKLVIRPDSGYPPHIICGNPDKDGLSPEGKGVMRLLDEIFGSQVNKKGYKILDPHIGAIYGDSISYKVGEEICQRLAGLGYASTNMVYGVGSFTYQYNTRDTLGIAMKATWALINGVSVSLYKAPVTDDGTKHSARGRLAVLRDVNAIPYLVNEATPEQEKQSCLLPVWKDGCFLRLDSFHDIAARMGRRRLLPDQTPSPKKVMAA